MRLFTSLTLAAGLAFGATPAPARADNSDLVRLLGGLVALGIIVETLDDDDHRHPPKAHRTMPRPHGYDHGPKPVPPRYGYTHRHVPSRSHARPRYEETRNRGREGRFDDTRRAGREDRQWQGSRDQLPRHRKYRDVPNR